MPRPPISLPSSRRSITLFASAVVLLLFVWQGRKGYNIGDEGFLWYGVQRVLAGEVPLRDFMAYDPGRYYWSAALLALWGQEGIMQLRAVVAIFQTLGLAAALCLLDRANPATSATRRRAFMLVSALILVLWMFPRHKLFDTSLSIFLIGMLAALIRKPDQRHFLLLGIGVGLTAVFGRNHGLYGVFGGLLAIIWLHLGPNRNISPGLLRAFAIWLTGVLLGVLPIVLMLALVPGFATAFWESIRFLFEHKATNITLPIPWPWHAAFGLQPWDVVARQVLMGLFFMALPIFGVIGLIWSFVSRLHGRSIEPVLMAAILMALPYAHYAYSRADIGHLALGIFPFLMGMLVLFARSPSRIGTVATLLLATASTGLMFVEHPGWQCRIAAPCVNLEISGSPLRIDPHTAASVNLLRQLERRHAPHGETFLATPLMPGAYPLLSRKAPVWAIYALFARGHAFEQQEIERLKAASPAFLLVMDAALDGRDELRFRNTHPHMQRHIEEHYEPIPDSPIAGIQLYLPPRTERP